MRKEYKSKCTTSFNKKEKLLYKKPIIETCVWEDTDVVTLSERENGDPNKIDFGELGL